MRSFVKCELCNVEISGETCIFATYRLVLDGREHYFCCEQHAENFKRQCDEQKSEPKKRTK